MKYLEGKAIACFMLTLFCSSLSPASAAFKEKLVVCKEPHFLYEYDYDAAGNQILASHTDGLDYCYEREERVYDEEHRVTSLITYIYWDRDKGEWYNIIKEDYQYDTQSRKTTSSHYIKKDEDWEFLDTHQYEYDANGTLQTDTEMHLKDGILVPYALTTYTYTESGQPLQVRIDVWRNGEYVTDKLKEWTYGEYGILSMTLSCYESGKAEILEEHRYVYEGSCNDYTYYRTITSSGLLNNKEKQIYHLDPAIGLTHWMTYGYDQYASGDEDDKYFFVDGYDYQYDEQGRLIMESVYQCWSECTRTEYQYDEYGHHLTKTYYTKEWPKDDEWKKSSMVKLENTYDEQGALLHTKAYKTGDFEFWYDYYTEVYTYDTSVPASQVAGCPSAYYKLLSYEKFDRNSKLIDSKFYTYAPIDDTHLEFIENIQQKNMPCFDMYGRQVKEFPSNGLLIRNEKKILIRE